MDRRILWFAALLVLAAPVSTWAQDTRILNGFNTEAELEAFRWGQVTKELSREHVTEGGRSVKVVFPGNQKYGGLGIRDPKLMADWHKWDLLAFDVFNPSTEIYRIVVRIDDDRTDKSDWATWYTGTFKIFPGENHIEIEITKLKRPHTGGLNTDKLTQLALWTAMRKEDKTLYFDNFALRRFTKATLPGKLRAFDFGGEKSNVFPGFALVTESARFTEEQGYGFRGAGELSSVEDAPRAAEALGKDAVGSGAGTPLTFAVKLPNGRYRLWAATGYVDAYNWPRKPYHVTANGREVFRHAPKSLIPREAADYLGRDYHKDADLWKEVAVGSLFDEFETELNVTDGKLELTVASEGAPSRLRALAVWPTGDQVCSDAMRRVHAERRTAFHAQWREIRPAKTLDPPKAMPWESQRGFILASRNYLVPITPYFVPKEEDRLPHPWAKMDAPYILRHLSTFAARGETEPLTFVVYPLRDLPGFGLSVGPLEGLAGRIPVECIAVHLVHYRYAREGEDAYSVQPGHLVPHSRLDLERGVPRQFWINIRVPEDAKQGNYHGKLTLSVGGKETTVPFDVTVYPFKLDRPEDHGYVYAHVSRLTNDPAQIEADLRCLREHGSNSVTPSGAVSGLWERADGRLVFDFRRGDMMMDIMKKLGMTGPVPLFDMSVQGYAGGQSRWHIGWRRFVDLDDWENKITELTEQVVAHAKEKDWLPVLMYPSTEISNDPGMGPATNTKIINAMRRAGKVQCISSVNRPEDVVTAKELDHIMINFGVGITQEVLDRIHASGAKLWFQNVGQTRYADGLFMLRSGAIGRRQWVAGWWSGDPYNDWDGREGNSMFFMSPVGSLPNVTLEWMREGVDDLRYFLTLKRLIAQARKAGGAARAAAEEAQKDYDEMIASCPVALPDGTRVFPDGLSVIEGFADKDTFDRYRRRAAGHIIKLNNALGRR